MKFFKFKYVVYFIILLICFFCVGFFSNKILKNKFVTFLNTSETFKEKIKFEKIEYNFFSLNGEVRIFNVSMTLEQINQDNELKNLQSDLYRQIYIPLVKIKVSFFEILKSIFSKNLNIKKITLSNPNVNFFFSNKIFFLDVFQNIDGKKILFEIVNGYLKIQNQDKSLGQIFENINGEFFFSGSNLLKTEVNFFNHKNLYNLALQIKKQNSKTNSEKEIFDLYDLKFSFKNQKNILNYIAKFDFARKEKKIISLDGEISSSGKNFLEFTKIFCKNCFQGNCQSDVIRPNQTQNKNLDFLFKAKTLISKDENEFLKIDEIKFNLGGTENEILGLIFYNLQKKKIYTNFLVKKLKFNSVDSEESFFQDDLMFSIQKIEEFLKNDLFFLKLYIDFLKKTNSENKLIIDEMNLNDKIVIKNLNSEFSSNSNFFNIKNLEVNLNKIFDIKIENHIDLKKKQGSGQDFKAFIKKNGVNYLNFSGKFFQSNVLIEDFVFINFDDNEIGLTKIFGNFELKFHSKSNFFFGNINIENLKLEDEVSGLKLHSNFEKMLNYFKFQKDETTGDFAKKILFLTQQYNLFYDLKLNFKNFHKNNEFFFKNLEIQTFVKDNKIISNISGENSLVKKFTINSFLMFKNYAPYLEMDVILNEISLNELKNQILKNSLLLNETEFRKNDSQNIWKNVDFNFNYFKNLNAKIDFVANNVKFDNTNIEKIFSKIEAKNNLLNLEAFNMKIDDFSAAKFAMNLDLEKMLFSGSFAANNIHYKNSLVEKLNDDQDNNAFIAEMDFSAIGKFSTIGDNLHSIIKNFNSNIKYRGENLILNKIDINGFVDSFDEAKKNNKIIALAERSVIFGETKIDEIKGDSSIRNSVIESNFEISGKNFNGAGVLNMFFKNFVFKALTRFAFFSKSSDYALNFVDLNLNGNFFNLSKNIDIESIRQEKKT